MAVLFTASGTAFPVLSEPYDDGGAEAVGALKGLLDSRTVRAYKPSACTGAAAHVAALEEALGWKPALDVEFDAMGLDAPSRASGSGPGRASLLGVAHYRRAIPADLDELCPLAEQYEKVEVLTALHSFDPAASRATQARNIGNQIVYVALTHGRIVARAQTNARGWTRDQIGGIFVAPEARGLGIGRGVVSALVADIGAQGKGVSLFVKKTNAIARSLYLSLGFSVAKDYRVSYFT